MKVVRKKSGQEGYVLLALMLAVTMILIALSIEAPRIAQQIKREKEEELYHRGMDYATAVKRFVHKSGGRYPLSIDQLEDTNHIRFLRKRYKDPMTGEDNWRLVHFGEAEIKIPTTATGLQTTNNPGLGGTSGGTSSGPGGRSSGFGGTSSGLGGGAGQGGTSSGFGGTSSGLGGTSSGLGGTSSGLGGTSSGLGGGVGQGGQGGQLGSLTTNNIGTTQPVGGGQIIGVASVNKNQSIKEFNDKDHYNDWFFVYDLRLEQAGGTGTAVAAPRAGTSTDSSGLPGQAPQPGTSAPGGGTAQPSASPAPSPSPSVPN